MLKASVPSYNEAVKVLVDRLLKDDHEFTQNRRSVFRTALLRPASIYLPGHDEPEQGFTRNISPDGVGIMIATTVEEGVTAKIRIHALRGRSPSMLAEARWCVPFGEPWMLTGWKFLCEAR